MKNELKAVLFDMDGVIVDTEPLHKKAYFAMFDAYNIPISEEMYLSFTGQSTQNICDYLVDEFQLSHTAQNLIDKKRSFFKHYFFHDHTFGLIEGVRELIEYYHAKGIKLVLASSASMVTINWVFDRFELHPYFVGKISGADLAASKPHPEIFEKAAEIAQEPREHCMVIEDSTHGVEAAKAANIYCAAFDSPHSKNQDLSLADEIISSFSELMRLP